MWFWFFFYSENHSQHDFDFKSFGKQWFWFQIFSKMILPNTERERENLLSAEQSLSTLVFSTIPLINVVGISGFPRVAETIIAGRSGSLPSLPSGWSVFRLYSVKALEVRVKKSNFTKCQLINQHWGLHVDAELLRYYTSFELLRLTNPRDAFRGQSRSPNMVPFNMHGFLWVCYSILFLRRIIFQIFNFKNAVTLKPRKG